jgi:hypothetical protein
MGSPTQYALGKAAAFPGEGGPAILQLQMPKSLLNFGTSIPGGGEVRFNPAGSDALRFNWDQVKTTVQPVEQTQAH